MVLVPPGRLLGDKRGLSINCRYYTVWPSLHGLVCGYKFIIIYLDIITVPEFLGEIPTET